MSETEPLYPIGAVSERTGLSPHLLRAWERRYEAVDPGRRDGGGRLYSAADIERLRLLRRLTAAGHPIGRIARLPTEELLSLAAAEAARTPAGEESSAVHLDRVLRATLAMDSRAVHDALMRAVVGLSSRAFTGEVVLPLLRQVGDLWEDGRICPAHEHVLSTQVVRVLGWLSAAIPVPPGAPEAVAVTPAGQRHEFGAFLAAVVAAEEGWRVTYLGPDLPSADVAQAVRTRGARVLLLSAVLEDDPGGLMEEIADIRARVGEGPRILVGGRGTESLGAEIASAGGVRIADLGALRVLLRELAVAVRGS